jgi:hypothetical protein
MCLRIALGRVPTSAIDLLMPVSSSGAAAGVVAGGESSAFFAKRSSRWICTPISRVILRPESAGQELEETWPEDGIKRVRFAEKESSGFCAGARMY